MSSVGEKDREPLEGAGEEAAGEDLEVSEPAGCGRGENSLAQM